MGPFILDKMTERIEMADRMRFEEFYDLLMKQYLQIRVLNYNQEMESIIRMRANHIIEYLVQNGVEIDGELAEVVGDVFSRAYTHGYWDGVVSVKRENVGR